MIYSVYLDYSIWGLPAPHPPLLPATAPNNSRKDSILGGIFLTALLDGRTHARRKDTGEISVKLTENRNITLTAAGVKQDLRELQKTLAQRFKR